MQDRFKAAADVVRNAGALVITTGAGMGVDSGLPDFRGPEGFWRAYPPYERLGIQFVDAANPEHFDHDPAFGWGFYGHRTNLYRETVPHRGFHVLLDWIDRFNLPSFVVTSNVDGQFQKAGFSPDAIDEIHGSIHFLQCTKPCSMAIWKNEETIDIDMDSMRSRSVPKCIHCGAVARPNILMFGDYGWVSDRSSAQRDRLDQFLAEYGDKGLVVIEAGAGTFVPSIRYASERLGSLPGSRVIRINPREPHIRSPHLSLECGALDGILGIDEALS